MRRARREEPEGGGGQRPLPVPQGAAGGGRGGIPPTPPEGLRGEWEPPHTPHTLPFTGGCPAREDTRPQPHPPPTSGPGREPSSPKLRGFRAWPRKKRRRLPRSRRGGAGRSRPTASLGAPVATFPGAQSPGTGPALHQARLESAVLGADKREGGMGWDGGGEQNPRKEEGSRNKHVFAATARRSLNFEGACHKGLGDFCLASPHREGLMLEGEEIRKCSHRNTPICPFSLAFRKAPGDFFHKWGGIDQTAIVLHGGSFLIGLPTLEVCIPV